MMFFRSGSSSRGNSFPFALALILFASLAAAQTFRGNLSGVVTDATGAAIPNTVVRLDSPSTGFTRTTTVTATGEYLFAELPVGVYKLTINSPGFETRVIDKAEVVVSKTLNIPVRMDIARQATITEVQASAVSIETTSTALVSVVDTKTVSDLPMNGRDFRQMVKLAPGVTPNGTSVNGMRTNGNNYQIDGADNNDAWSNNVAVNQGGVSGIAGALLPIEAIDQFSVQTNAAADMGRNGGSNVNMVIKSGTNQIHGSLFYFNRNEALAVFSPVQTLGTPKQVIRNNQFGFSLGGPIIKNRTFFFITGESQLAIAQNSVLDTTISNAWLDSAKSVLTRYGVALNPVTQNLLALFPSESKNGPATSNNWVSNAQNDYNSFNGIIKIDHRFNDKHSINARYLGGTGTQTADVGSHFHDYFQQAPMHVHNYSIVESSVLTSRMINQVTLGVNYFLQTFNDFNTSFNPIAAGLNTGIDPTSTLVGSPTVRVSGFDYAGATNPLGRIDTTGHITDNLVWTTGRHQIKVGGEFRRAVLDVAYFTNLRGTFTFDGSRGPWATDTTVSSSLRSLSDFLAGYTSNSSGATIVRGDLQRVYHVNSGDWWIHDNFQVNQRLSLNYGVRFTYQGVLHDTKNSLANFIPGKGWQVGNLYPQDKNNYAPRFGFAFTPKRNGKTVLRGSYGIYYDIPTVGSFAYASLGNGGATGLSSNPAGPQPAYTLSVRNVTLQPGAAIFGTASPTPPFGAYAVNPNFRTPYVQNFNFNIQHQLSSTTLLQAGYVGSLGRKLLVPLDINQPVGGIRPFAATNPELATINQLNSIANSNYNSLQLALRQSVWKGIVANFNYTYGHSIDTASSNAVPGNSYNLRNDRGSSSFDQRQIFTSFVSYTIPKWTGFAPRLTSGWQLNSLITYGSGQPINFSAGTNVSGSGQNKDRVDLVGNPYANVPVLTNTRAVQYFNPAAFARPAAGTFGNLGRDTLAGPGFGAVDFSVFKRVPIKERVTVEVRAEIFNMLNRTNWANPNTTFTSASFGQLTQTRNGSSAPGLGFGEPRNTQLGMKITF